MQLLERIPPSTDDGDCQRTAIEGLGGVGKTQIALEAASRVRKKHPDCSVFWVPAVDATSFENAYREIGRKLNIGGGEEKTDIKLLVKTALSQESAGYWLLIVDNADDTELLFDNTALINSLPFSRKGSILFTTRNHKVVVRLDVPERNRIPVTEMSRSEAIELLQRNLKGSQIRDAESTMGLLDFLADLPLAIKQASAYISETGISTTKYLKHCQSTDKTLIQLMKKDFEDRSRYEGIGNAIATTWLISFDHISRNALAMQYLQFMCFFAEKDIPVSLLPPADELDMDEALGTLKAYAFITQRERQDSFDMHRLVRLVMRNWLNEKGQLQECCTSVLQRLADVFPRPNYGNRNEWMKYLSHVQTTLDYKQDMDNKEVESYLLLIERVGESLDVLGKYREAEPVHRQTFALKKKVLGNEHPHTLTSMNNLARILNNQGKHKESEQIHRQTHVLMEKVLGNEHHHTLANINDLAAVFHNQGKFEEAEQMYRQTHVLLEKVLGNEHHHTLTNMSNVAGVLYDQGNFEEAEQIRRQTCILMEKVLGKEHPDTLISMNNLASILYGQEKYEEAEQMYRQILVLMEKVLGNKHHHTLTNINNLASVLNKQGKFEEAEQMYRQTHVLMEKVLGNKHHHTLTSMNNLAGVLNNQGKFEEAEQMYRQTYVLMEKVLGNEHHHTLISMNNLAGVLHNRGKFEEAEQLYRKTLVLMEKVVGKEHPETLNSMSNLASVLNKQGKFEEAENLGGRRGCE